KIPAVSTVHSEFPVERPFVSDRITKYICIRESILDKVVEYDCIPREKTIHIPNGFDTERFNKNYIPIENNPEVILFVGTIDEIRKTAITHLLNFCSEFDYDLQIIGTRVENYLDGHPNWLEVDGEKKSIWNIEKYVKQCDYTAGVTLGRTTIEGWLCGKSAFVYDLNIFGKVTGVAIHEPPSDVGKYDIKNIVDRIERVYLEAMV
ncbi:unnamed protein product, partial [marine sediment metagenome]